MSNPSSLGAVLFSTESAWAENSSSVATRLPVLGSVDASGLVHSQVEAMRVSQYKQGGSSPFPGVMGGSFKLRTYLTGHGSTTAGAMSATDLRTYLALVLGGSSTGPTGDTFTGGTAAAPTTTGATGFSAGQLGRAGALGDGASEGQWFAVGTHSSNNLTLLTALPAAPDASDVMYSSEVVHVTEGPTVTALTGVRFLLQTANNRFLCHGCYPMSASFSGLANGEIPEVEVEWGVSWWEPEASSTWPSVTSVDQFVPAPSAGGSFFFQQVGTVTRQTYTINSFALNVGLGIVPIMGPGGANQYQAVIGARRVKDTIGFDFTVEAAAASATPTWWSLWSTGSQKYHCLYSVSIADGSAVAFYFPSVCITGDRPTQVDDSGVNRIKVSCTAYTGATTTSDLTLSAMRIGLA